MNFALAREIIHDHKLKLKLETAELEKQKAETLLEAEREKSDREIKHIEHTHEMEWLEMKAKTGVSTSEVETIKAKDLNYQLLMKEKMKWTAIYTGLNDMQQLKTGNPRYGLLI